MSTTKKDTERSRFRCNGFVRDTVGLLPYCRTRDIGVMVYGLLAHGLLTGTVKPDTTFAAGDWRGRSDIFSGSGFLHNLEIVARLERLAADLGATISQLAIAWALAQPGVHVAVVGAQHLNYLEDNVRATELVLSDTTWPRSTRS